MSPLGQLLTKWAQRNVRLISQERPKFGIASDPLVRSAPDLGHRQLPDRCPLSATCGSGPTLFDHFVRGGSKRSRDFKTERFCCLEIDHGQEFGGLLDRKLARFGAAQ